MFLGTLHIIILTQHSALRCHFPLPPLHYVCYLQPSQHQSYQREREKKRNKVYEKERGQEHIFSSRFVAYS